MTQGATEQSNCTFSVSEHSDAHPWIMIETDRPGLRGLGNGFIGLQMREDISFDDASKLAQLLRDNVTAISYTSLK
jgi:hypothetical protein